MPVVLNVCRRGRPKSAELFVHGATYPGNSGGPSSLTEAAQRHGETIVAVPPRCSGIVLITNLIEAGGYERPLHLGVACHIQQLVRFSTASQHVSR